MTRRAPWPMVVPAGTKNVGTATVHEDASSVGWAQKKLAEKFGTRVAHGFDEMADGVELNPISQSIAHSARTAAQIGDPAPLEPALALMTKKRSKYGNRKVVVDGITFDSVREGARYTKLAAMRTAGQISDLRIQVPFEVVPAAVVGGRKRPARKYIADFVYRDAAGAMVVEDVKGMRTAVYSMKRQLMKAVHGIDIVEVK